MNTHHIHQERRTMLRRMSAVLAGAFVIGMTLSAPAVAQEKPSLRVLVGFPPGGSVDILARNLAEAMRDDFGTIIVENKPGAAGRIALAQLKAAKPDGLTVIVAPSPGFVLFPHIFKKLDYDPNKDFTPISQLASMPFGITTGPNTGVKTIAEMAAKAKADPINVTVGSSGEGSAGHVLSAWLGQAVNAKMTHVPFQGGAPANLAMLAGTVGYRIDALSETTDLHKTGKARILAVTSSKRYEQLPDVPTLKELGINLEASSWFAMFAPAGLPRDVQDRLNQAVVKAIKRPDFAEKLNKMGFEPNGTSAAQLAAQQKIDFDAWAIPAKAINLQLD